MDGGFIVKFVRVRVQERVRLWCPEGVCGESFGASSCVHSWFICMIVFNHVYSAAEDVCGFVGRVNLYAFDF